MQNLKNPLSAMPANRRKKKPASNPARGFATTSTASKTKSSNNQENDDDNGSSTANHDVDSPQDDAAAINVEPRKEAERPLQELSPEELENQLEESRLQILIEKHGSKVTRDVSRQVSRLQTERRLLRNQAMPLCIRHWLPEEIMQLVTCQLKTQQDSDLSLDISSESRQVEESMSEDDLIIKIWVLRQILIQLEFPLEVTLSVLRHLLMVCDSPNAQKLCTGKDSVWGLDACLSWLAFEAKSEDLPRLETSTAKKLPVRGRKLKVSTESEEPGEYCC